MKDAVTEYGIVLLAIVAAVVLCTIPLQHYMPLSRYQHYSIGLSVIAAGMFFQSLVSRRRIGGWGCAALISAASFIAACAYFFYNNPWLGNPDLATDEQLIGRQHFLAGLAACLLPLSYFWIRFGLQRQKQEQSNAQGYKEHSSK